MRALKRRALQEVTTLVCLGLVVLGVCTRDWTVIGLACFMELVKCGHALTDIAGYLDSAREEAG